MYTVQWMSRPVKGHKWLVIWIPNKDLLSDYVMQTVMALSILMHANKHNMLTESSVYSTHVTLQVLSFSMIISSIFPLKFVAARWRSFLWRDISCTVLHMGLPVAQLKSHDICSQWHRCYFGLKINNRMLDFGTRNSHVLSTFDYLTKEQSKLLKAIGPTYSTINV